jgi:hypothetical protein
VMAAGSPALPYRDAPAAGSMACWLAGKPAIRIDGVATCRHAGRLKAARP